MVIFFVLKSAPSELIYPLKLSINLHYCLHGISSLMLLFSTYLQHYKQVSYIQPITGSCFFYFDKLYLLVEFRPFIFNVVIDVFGFKSITSIFVFYFCHVLFVLLSPFSAFFWIHWIFFMIPFLSLCWLISYNSLLCYFSGFFFL